MGRPAFFLGLFLVFYGYNGYGDNGQWAMGNQLWERGADREGKKTVDWLWKIIDLAVNRGRGQGRKKEGMDK